MVNVSGYVMVRGAFGEVRLAFVKTSCEKVAVKVIEKKSFTAATTTDAVSFSSFLTQLVHACILVPDSTTLFLTTCY